RCLDYGDASHLLHQMHRTELRGPTNRARLSSMRAGHIEIYFNFNIEKQQGCNDSLSYTFSLRSKELYYFTLKNSEKCTIAYHATKCRRVENFRCAVVRYIDSLRVDISIFLISLYSIVANQDKAINQNMINTAANHKDIILISDLQPQELLCRLLEIRDLCRLQLKDTIIML
ncbi:hypothetical protein ALC60_04203, partial [Trachymyrmex zeteki]